MATNASPVTVRLTHKENAGPEIGCKGAREMHFEVTVGAGEDSQFAAGTAIVIPDTINGGWQVLGNSLDMWLSPSIVELLGDRREVVEEIVAMACNGRVASREVRS